MRMLGNRLLVKPVIKDNVTTSGIMIPAGATSTVDEMPTGTVVLVGKDVKEQIDVGDTVLYAKYGGIPLDYEGDDCMILRDVDILAVQS